MSEIQQLTFNVSNMKCGGCVSAVEAALDALKETSIVEVSLENNRAVVLSSLDVDDIAKAITEAGYPAEFAG